MIKFFCMGSGSSGNSYFLSTGDTSILIDAGISVRRIKKYLKDYGFSLDQIDAVLVTHDHADHIKAVGHLANDHNIKIYATELVHKGINHNYCVTSKLTPEHQVIINKGETIQIGDLKLTPFEVPHDSTDCVGYRVEQNGIVYCLITDIGEVTPTVQKQIADARYLVIESNHDTEMLENGPYSAYLKNRILSAKGHLSNKACAEAIVKYATPELRHVWLCHLSEENNHPELARKTMETELSANGLRIGVEFDMDILKRITPSELYELF